MKHLFLAFTAIVLFASCNSKELERLQIENKELRSNLNKLKTAGDKPNSGADKLNFLSQKTKDIKVVFNTNYGDIKAVLYGDKAPITVLNFVAHAEGGFYDNTQFHRVIKGFMIQGGDPNTKDSDPYNDGQGGPKIAIPHEFNELKHEAGVLSMARVGDVTAGAGSQFFIMHGTSPHLDNQYTVFGRVTEGLDIVDKIANVEIKKDDPRLSDRPVKPVILKKITIL